MQPDLDPLENGIGAPGSAISVQRHVTGRPLDQPAILLRVTQLTLPLPHVVISTTLMAYSQALRRNQLLEPPNWPLRTCARAEAHLVMERCRPSSRSREAPKETPPPETATASQPRRSRPIVGRGRCGLFTRILPAERQLLASPPAFMNAPIALSLSAMNEPKASASAYFIVRPREFMKSLYSWES
jgi:hypothetical protein